MRFLIASALFCTIFAGAANAEIWTCKYAGTYRANQGGESGKLEWTTTWTDNDDGWRITGELNDKFGKSSLKGDCLNSVCKLTQTYSSGSLVGKPFTYQGNYLDENISDGKMKNTIGGTWSGNGKTGSWNVSAICTRND